MMKTIITLMMALALSGSISAQQEKKMAGGACCAKGSSRAALMSGVPVGEVVIKDVVTKDDVARVADDKKASCGKCVKKGVCAACKDGKMCAKCVAKKKAAESNKVAEKKIASKKAKLQRKFVTDPLKIDLRQVKKRMDGARGK